MLEDVIRELHLFVNGQPDQEELLTSRKDTLDAIDEANKSCASEVIIFSTDLTQLSRINEYIEKGWRIFIHNDSDIAEIMGPS